MTPPCGATAGPVRVDRVGDPVAEAVGAARGFSRPPATPPAITRRAAHAPLLAKLAGQSLQASLEEPW